MTGGLPGVVSHAHKARTVTTETARNSFLNIANSSENMSREEPHAGLLSRTDALYVSCLSQP